MSKIVTWSAVIAWVLIVAAVVALPPVGAKEQTHEDRTAAIVAELRLSIAKLKLRVDSHNTGTELNVQMIAVVLDKVAKLSKEQQESYKVVNLMGDRLDKHTHTGE